MHEIHPSEIKENPIQLFDQSWALLTAGRSGDLNTMTISWGSLGTCSGRDSDKIAESGLTLELLASGQPSFAEADMVIEARKIYGAPFSAEGFGDVPAAFYASRGIGIHSVYIGEIEHVWVRGREEG